MKPSESTAASPQPVQRGDLIGKLLYALVFLVLVPVFLVVWAQATADVVRLPVIGDTFSGMVLAATGAVVMLWGMAALMVYGRGLPMNAYPPRYYVTRGMYRLLPHPIYTGFVLLCFGVAIAAQSASGLWLVSPAVLLGCSALVYGYERHDLHRRFPAAMHAQPLLHLPASTDERPTVADRCSVYLLVFLPWFLLYEAVAVLGIPPDATTLYLPFEHTLPVYEWTELFYGGTYLFVLAAPLVARRRDDLRGFAVAGLIATGVITLLFFTLPLIAPPRPFVPQSWLGTALLWERTGDTPAAAFPSFHVVWALLAARLYTRTFPALRVLWWLLAVLMALSCLTTGMHAVADIAGGFLAFLLIDRRAALWKVLRCGTERLANSWREWRAGPVRFINHGLYAGLGAWIGLALAGTLLGPGSTAALLLTCLCILGTAALWAQIVEGSPALLRPYGWYGGLMGALIGALLSTATGTDPWLLLAAFSVGAPWVQASGRLRCLVQGCCHGRKAPAQVGICYSHPRSRVCRISGLAGVPLHPTPLYSIAWNAVLVMVMTRLWFLHLPASFLVGVYLLLSNAGRFVEESYRGEPQTPLYAGLRLYQWMAVAGVVAGAVVTMIDGTPHTPVPQVHTGAFLAAAGCAVVTTAALGADLPDSTARFSRLA